MKTRHHKKPLSWDRDLSWDARVVYTPEGFIRYLDRNGDTHETITR